MDKAIAWAYAGMVVACGLMTYKNAVDGHWLGVGIWGFTAIANGVCCYLRFANDRIRRQNEASIEDLEARARAADEVLTELERRVAARQPRGVKP